MRCTLRRAVRDPPFRHWVLLAGARSRILDIRLPRRPGGVVGLDAAVEEAPGCLLAALRAAEQRVEEWEEADRGVSGSDGHFADVDSMEKV